MRFGNLTGRNFGSSCLPSKFLPISAAPSLMSRSAGGASRDEPSCAVKAFKDVYIRILEAVDTYVGKEPQFTESIRDILNRYHDDESEHETIVRFYHDMIHIVVRC
jgi:hypothetical protein